MFVNKNYFYLSVEFTFYSRSNALCAIEQMTSSDGTKKLHLLSIHAKHENIIWVEIPKHNNRVQSTFKFGIFFRIAYYTSLLSVMFHVFLLTLNFTFSVFHECFTQCIVDQSYLHVPKTEVIIDKIEAQNNQELANVNM